MDLDGFGMVGQRSGHGSAWIRNGSAMDLHGLAGPEGWTETGSSESVIGRCDRSWSRAIANGSGDSRERVRQESNGGWRWPSMDSHGSEMVGDGSAWFPDGAAWILNGPGMDLEGLSTGLHGSGTLRRSVNGLAMDLQRLGHGSAWIWNGSAMGLNGSGQRKWTAAWIGNGSAMDLNGSAWIGDGSRVSADGSGRSAMDLRRLGDGSGLFGTVGHGSEMVGSGRGKVRARLDDGSAWIWNGRAWIGDGRAWIGNGGERIWTVLHSDSGRGCYVGSEPVVRRARERECLMSVIG